MWSKVVQWLWPRFFKTPGLCLGLNQWPLQCLILHLPMLLPHSFLFWLLVTVQLCVKALLFPKCFQTSCIILSITSLAISLKSLVLGGLLWQFSSSLNFFFAGIHLYVCWREGCKFGRAEEHTRCFTSCKQLWLASYVLLCRFCHFSEFLF